MLKISHFLGVVCSYVLLLPSCKKDEVVSQDSSILADAKILTTEDSYVETQPPVQTQVSYNINSNVGGYL